MLIKLHYTALQDLTTGFRLFAYILNNSGITSISSLVSSLNAASAWSTFTSTLDTTNSYIVRTNAASGSVAHMARGSSASSVPYLYDLFIRQQIHDLPAGNYVYYRIFNTSNSQNNDNYLICSAISNAAIDSTQWAITATNTGTTTQGGQITTAGTQTATGVASNQVGFYTAWFYITDYSIMWAFNADSSSGLGISTSSYGGSSTGWTGQKFISQYRRFDYWNTSANNIIPVVYTNKYRAGPGIFTSTSDYNALLNPQAANTSEAMFQVVNLVSDAVPSNSAVSWTVSNQVQVAWGVGTRFSDVLAMTSSATTVNTTATGPNTGQMLWIDSGNVNTRMPIANLQNRGYPIMPFTWRNMRYNSMGGNISEIGDFYLFNGDYFPGDEFTWNNRTFVLFPTGQSWTSRLAIAIPKE